METNQMQNPELSQPQEDCQVTLPRPRVGFKQAVKKAMTSGFGSYSGRSRRSEYWWFFLFIMLLSLGLFLPTMIYEHIESHCSCGMDAGYWPVLKVLSTTMAFLGVMTLIVFAIPSLCISVRRLHDSGHSGKWVLWSYLANFAERTFARMVFGSQTDLDPIQRIYESFDKSWLTGMGMTCLTLADVVMTLIILYFLLLDSDKGENKYGPSPKYQ